MECDSLGTLIYAKKLVTVMSVNIKPLFRNNLYFIIVPFVLTQSYRQMFFSCNTSSPFASAK